MSYKIQIEHDSGNSYGSNELFTDLEFEWTDKSITQENVRRIKEHYDFILLLDGNEAKFNPLLSYLNSKLSQSITDIAKVKNWAEVVWAKDYSDDLHLDRVKECSLKLIAPNGKEYVQQVFWYGYHDCLINVRVTSDLLTTITDFLNYENKL